jgi:cytochrome c oxidase assembly protein subunit 15
MASRPLPRPRPIAFGRWLLVVAALVFAIVVVGGITRLTESGLSITSWKPISGILPPLTDAQWQAEFAGYKRIPQYAAFNRGMTLEGFKHIFFWEYVHRLLARAIGTVLAIVLAVSWWRRWVPAGYGRRTLLILALGGLQGLIGWWMVASGLSERTEVSHLRLATHLLAAMLIYSVLIWTALDLLNGGHRSRLRGGPALVIGMVAVQLVLGAFTAGLRAGYAFASWPMMGDGWFPDGGWNAAHPVSWNLLFNPVVIQFVHRWWAWAVAMAVALLARSAWREGSTTPALLAIGLVAVQIALGIATLLSGVALPIAVAHQATAALLLGSVIWCAHAIGQAESRSSLHSGRFEPIRRPGSTVAIS